MEWLTELIEKIKMNNFNIASTIRVDVTHINNPHSFYVRPIEYNIYLPNLRAYEKLIDASEIKLRALVVYKSRILKSYTRGQIFFVEVQEGEIKCDIYAPDDGFFEKLVPLNDIHEPRYKIDIPPLATHCQLADCKPNYDSWNKKAIEAMKYYVGTEQADILIRGRAQDGLIVELKNSCPDDIATLLALTGYTTFGYGQNVISRLSTPKPENHYYTYKTLHVGDVLHVRVQSGNSLKGFYVAQVNDYKKYLFERDNFTYFCKKQKPLLSEEMKEKKAVGVLNSYCKYERGIIKTIIIPNTKAKVQLVDWGTEVEANISQMKPMTQKCFHNPVVAIYCSAEESQVWDNGLHKFLFPGYEFFIAIKVIGKDFESPHIVKISSIDKK